MGGGAIRAIAVAAAAVVALILPASAQTPDIEALLVVEQGEGRLTRQQLDGATEVLADGLRDPRGVAVAPDGKIYVTEGTGGRVLQIRPGKKPKSVADDLDGPEGITATEAGLYVTTFNDGRLLRIGAGGKITEIARGLDGPAGVAVMDSRIIVAEFQRGTLLELPADAERASRGAARVIATRLGNPDLIAAGPDGNVYVADFRGRLLRVDPDTGRVRVLVRGAGQPVGVGIVPLREGGFAVAVTSGNSVGLVDPSSGEVRPVAQAANGAGVAAIPAQQPPAPAVTPEATGPAPSPAAGPAPSEGSGFPVVPVAVGGGALLAAGVIGREVAKRRRGAPAPPAPSVEIAPHPGIAPAAADPCAELAKARAALAAARGNAAEASANATAAALAEEQADERLRRLFAIRRAWERYTKALEALQKALEGQSKAEREAADGTGIPAEMSEARQAADAARRELDEAKRELEDARRAAGKSGSGNVSDEELGEAERAWRAAQAGAHGASHAATQATDAVRQAEVAANDLESRCGDRKIAAAPAPCPEGEQQTERREERTFVLAASGPRISISSLPGYGHYECGKAFVEWLDALSGAAGAAAAAGTGVRIADWRGWFTLNPATGQILVGAGKASLVLRAVARVISAAVTGGTGITERLPKIVDAQIEIKRAEVTATCTCRRRCENGVWVPQPCEYHESGRRPHASWFGSITHAFPAELAGLMERAAAETERLEAAEQELAKFKQSCGR